MQIRKSLADQQQKYFAAKQDQIGNMSINLPHEISNQLVLKTRENAQEIIKILVQNRIFKKDSVIIDTRPSL